MGEDFILTNQDYDYLKKATKRWEKTKSIREASEIVEYLAKYVKDVIDDPDAEEGFVFNRFYADTMFMNDPIDWDEML